MIFRLPGCLIFLLFCSNGLFAQVPNHIPFYQGHQSQYGIYQWTTSNGLPQSRVTSAVQSKNHLIWIGTYDGIAEFDGKRFTSVRPKYHDKRLSQRVTALSAKGDTIIWSTLKELVFFYDKKIIAYYPLQRNTVVQSIIQQGNQTFVCTEDVIYRVNDKKLTPVLKAPGIRQTLILGNELICLQGAGQHPVIHTLNIVTDNYRKIKTEQAVKGLGIFQNVPWIFDGYEWKPLQGHAPSQPGVLSKKRLVPSLAAGTITGSFLIQDEMVSYNRDYIVIEDSKNEPALLQTGTILYGDKINATLRDHAGNIWLGSSSYGLFMIRNYPFELINFNDKQPIVNSTHAFIDQSEIIWFDNGCEKTLGYDKNTKHRVFEIDAICNDVNLDWGNDSICLFSRTSRHYWFNKKNRELSPLKGVKYPVNVCLKLANGTSILGSTGKLLLWDGKTASTWKVFQSTSTICNQVLRISDSEYYFATTEGLYHLVNKHWDFSKLTIRSDFRSLHWMAGRKQLLIGTAGEGILLFTPAGKKLIRLPKTPSEITNSWCMIEDRYHQLWITTNNGIVQVYLPALLQYFYRKTEGITTNHFRYEHGIQNVEFNSQTQDKGTLLKNGDILFSSFGGPVLVHPKSNVSFNNVLSSIFIDRLSINGTPADLKSEIRLKEGEFARVHFVLPAYSSERVLVFECRVKGYRNYWRPLTGTALMMDNLPAGNYVLEIRLVSGQRKLSIPVIVSKRNPNSWIIYLILGLLISVTIAYSTYLITRTVQRRKHNLKSMKQQLRLLETEALRAQMSPHFTFNCLNTIQFLFISGNIEKANKYLTDFSSLMRITTELLRQQITTLNEEITATSLYIELEQLQFDTSFDFRLINNLETPIDQIRIPTLLFQIFVENAIVHGLKKTTEPVPVLTIILDEHPDSFEFRVCDNGPGLSSEPRENHTSLGLTILKERFAVMRELYQWNIDFRMHEREVLENDIKTEIIITFDKKLLEAPINENPDR